MQCIVCMETITSLIAILIIVLFWHDDQIYETGETFIINLSSNNPGVVLNITDFIVTIQDDDSKRYIHTYYNEVLHSFLAKKIELMISNFNTGLTVGFREADGEVTEGAETLEVCIVASSGDFASDVELSLSYNDSTAQGLN